MATIQEREILATKIIPVIWASHARLPKADLTAFLSMTGHLYKGDLMVIGRALNGWLEHGFLPADLNDSKNADTFVDEVYKSVTEGYRMEWVSEHWGAATKYNTRRSAFWRVIRTLISSLQIADVNSPEWPSYLVWSNLYKVAPKNEGNPNSTLRNLQLPGCLDLFRLELITYKPKRLLFLTGMDWASPFLNAVNAQIRKNASFRYVEGFGQISITEEIVVQFAVASHPQGKPESPWIKEVTTVFESS